MSIRPRIIANFAITSDGKVSTRSHTPAGFTSPRDKRHLLEIRALGDAILAGKNTIQTDNMSMGISAEDLRLQRLKKGLSPVPLRVVFSNSGNMRRKWKIFQNDASKIIIFTTKKFKPALQKKLPPHVDVKISKTNPLKIEEALRILRVEYNVRTLICEGGPTLFRSLVESKAVDEIYITITPLLFGGKTAPTLTAVSKNFLSSIPHFKLRKMRQIGDELFLHYITKSS